MSNLLTSSQTTATSAPSYYSDYLSNLASNATSAANAAQYVGATDLQKQAFADVSNAGSSYLPGATSAANTLNAATTATSPLAAASNYFTSATQDPSKLAASYISPWLSGAVNTLSDVGQSNILNTLLPAVNAGSVGSGQFGSQRGLQAAGQTGALAEQGLNQQIAGLLNTGYGQALTTAEAQNALNAQLGTAAANAASQGQTNLISAGTAEGNLAAQTQNEALAKTNAEATLGAQEQLIGQNEQLFPLTKLAAAANVMSGQAVPTTTTTQLNTSPLSAASTLGSLYTALNTTPAGGGTTPWQNIMKSLGLSGGTTGAVDTGTTGSSGTSTSTNTMDYSGGLSTPQPSSTSPTGWVDDQGNAVNADSTPYDPTAG